MIAVPDSVHGFPSPRRCHGLAEWKEEVYIFGGFDGSVVSGPHLTKLVLIQFNCFDGWNSVDYRIW